MEKNKLLALKDTLKSTAVVTKASEIPALIMPYVKSDTKADKFTKDILEVISSDEFIIEIDKNIGEVKENETEQEFVNRGKNIIKNLLRSKLK